MLGLGFTVDGDEITDKISRQNDETDVEEMDLFSILFFHPLASKGGLLACRFF